MRMFNPIAFPHNRLSKRCRTGIHILAIDEDRLFFRNRSWDRHKRVADGVMRQVWMPGVHSDVGGTAGPFWGRASFLAMTQYIDHFTALRLDRSWLARKEAKFRADLDAGAYRIRQHRPVFPFRTQRQPTSTECACEFLHPVVDMIAPEFRYNGRPYPWRERQFAPRFGGMTVDPVLDGYFQSL
jgi:hypothetical protein